MAHVAISQIYVHKIQQLLVVVIELIHVFTSAVSVGTVNVILLYREFVTIGLVVDITVFIVIAIGTMYVMDRRYIVVVMLTVNVMELIVLVNQETVLVNQRIIHALLNVVVKNNVLVKQEIALVNQGIVHVLITVIVKQSVLDIVQIVNQTPV